MATYYVWSGATGAADGTSKTDAYTTLQAGLTAATTIGDIVLVHKTHSENASADYTFTVNSAHTKEQPLQIICVDMDASDVPVTNYQASGNGEIDCSAGVYHILFFNGSTHIWGMRFLFQDSSAPHLRENTTFERCLYENKRTTAENLSVAKSSLIRFIDCDINLGASAVRFVSIANEDGGSLEVIGGSISNSASGTSGRVLLSSGGSNGKFLFSGVDLTGLSTTSTIVEITGAVELLDVTFINCKLPATEPTLFTGTKTNLKASSSINMTFDDAYRRFHVNYVGQLQDNTTIYRSGGANDGTTDFSLKIESGSNAKASHPYRILLACQNYGNLSGKTMKIHFAQNSGGSPVTAIKDIDIWLEVHSSVDFTSTRALPLATGVNHTDESGSENWRNGASALSGYTEQSISASGFGATSDMVYVWLCVARDFSTDNLYVCPKIEIA